MNKKKPSILLVSIDAVRSDLALNPEKYGIKLPNISKFVDEGSYAADGVSPVFPSYTYACHPSIMTGANPATHGNYANKQFDPTGKHMESWYWYVSDKVPTLWKYAKDNGYLSVNMGLPGSVLAETDYNIPEYWRDTTELDNKLLEAVCVPQGLSKEAEKEAGKIRCGIWDIEDDHVNLKTSLWLLENKVKPHLEEKPFFMTTYFAAYDDLAHGEGTFAEKPLEYLEKTDEYLGELIDKAIEITDGNVIICVISDHGMLDNKGNVNPNSVFLDEGLIELDEFGNVEDWRVWTQRCGGAANIQLKDSEDDETRAKVRSILEKMAQENPTVIDEIMTGQEAEEKRKGLTESDFVMTTKPGYEVREDMKVDFLEDQPTQKAQHGYDENLEEMQAMFFIKGPGIEANKKIDRFSIIDIAPTLANLMGFEMETAEGKNIL